MIHDKIHCTTLSNQKKKKNPYRTDDLDCSLRNNKANRQFKKKLVFLCEGDYTNRQLTLSYTSYWHKPITTSLIHFDKTCITINITWGFPVVPIQNKINRAMLLHPGTINFFFSY